MGDLWLILIVGTILWLTVALFNRKSGPAWRFLVILPLLLSMVSICFLVGVISFGVRKTHHVLDDPAAAFTQRTGLPWPESASIVSASDDHAGFGEGELHIIFDVQPADFARLLNGPSPWGKSEWQRGPVPPEIGFHCHFGTSGVAMTQAGNKPAEYSGDPKLVNLLGSHDVLYDANERCCESLRWHNGSLLVMDPATHRVWLSIWDW